MHFFVGTQKPMRMEKGDDELKREVRNLSWMSGYTFPIFHQGVNELWQVSA